MAGTYNRVVIIGRLGRDPELKYTQNGSPVCNMSLATDESYKRDGEWVKQTEWHKAVVWGKQAEMVANYLSKGSMALVEGSLQNNKWQDQQGNNRVSTEVKAQRVVFMDSKQQVTGDQGKPSQDDPFAFSGGATDDSAPF
jgi:single-strand DNA-binding protein